MADLLKKYLFENRTVKVQALRLHDTWRDAQVHHDYPPAIQRILGELVAASALLAANLKFDGSLVLQLQGDGPVSLIVVECRADLSLRATVKVRREYVVPDNGTLKSLVNPGGNGRFIVVLDPARKVPGQQAYQGIVPIESDSVAKVLEDYMASSEQLDTRLILAADAQHAAGMLVQRLPDSGGTSQDASDPHASTSTFEHASVLIDTVKTDELITTDTDTLIHRLFWDDPLLAFEPQLVRWHCSCSRERIADMLRMLGVQEVNDILEERGAVEVNCEFCGKPYHFDPVDCAGLFTGPAALPEQDPPTRH
ncbi:MAG: Hsp33 family molecular chaperone HslO [Comamonadaceae bacterium]|nr:MAG: Hsp33 family molecular chaperone HslO [Comamonadaceae bacterium]